MPPLPSALDEETSNLISSLGRRQKDLAEFQIPRLRQCTGPLSVQQQYAAELRDDLDTFARQVETLDVAVEDQRTERARRELRQVVEGFKTTLTGLRKDMRSAVLASKRAIDSQQLSRQEELLRSYVVHEKQTLNEKVTEDALMKANNDVTEALQRTIGLMQGELERSVLSTQLLESSTAALKSTSSTHDVLSTLMSTSKHLITALEKSDWLDRLVILAALAFFILVVLFILKQRLVDRGLRIALWWTHFVPDFSGDEALLAVGRGQGSAVATASSIVATASTVLGSVSTAVASFASPAPSFDDAPPNDSARLEERTTSLQETLSPAAHSLPSDEPPSSSETSSPGATAGQHDEL
ncbi:Sec20-domain-containing protein [Trametes meyenii]|nr:Sec20-domain-containing protein [Trametes meyenii]